MANINRVVLVGNLTRDPELRHTPSGQRMDSGQVMSVSLLACFTGSTPCMK